ncbi:hypothetical protein KY345_01240 [Candidatus Woesearchaeota archaeon]|nr:hypothetical protein [Candidatus Woesearchaeota archaeon]
MKEQLHVMHKGTERDIMYHYSRVRAIPFSGFTTNETRFGKMGPGLMFDDGSAIIWGYASPHDIVASYRSMRLLQHVADLDKVSLYGCFETARKKGASWQNEKAVNDLIQHINPITADRVLNEPLPSIDDAIEQIEREGGYFRPIFVIEAVRDGYLKRTETVNRVVRAYGDENLAVDCLNKEYRDFVARLREIEKKNIARGAIGYLPLNPLQECVAYNERIESILPELLDSFEEEFRQLKSEIHIEEPLENCLDKFHKKKYNEKKSESERYVSDIDSALSRLRETCNSSIEPNRRFLTYVDGLKELVEKTKEIRSKYHSVVDVWGMNLDSAYRAQDSATKIIKALNREVKSKMSDFYSVV